MLKYFSRLSVRLPLRVLPACPHAVTTAGTMPCCYNANGNMTQRNVPGTYDLSYDAENCLVGASGAATATFLYDGDGARVQGCAGGVTTAYIGNHFEWTGSTGTMKKYYYAGATRVAMRRGSTLYFLLADHLGSTHKMANADGSNYTSQLYQAWGEKRYPAGASTLLTTFRFTGQREQVEIGLYFYGARWWDSSLSRFAQADTLIPLASQGVQAWDRYAGMNNNPVRHRDPSGHWICEGETCKKEYRYNQKSNGFYAPNSNLWISGNSWLNPPTHKGADYGDPPSEIIASGYGTVVVADPCSLGDCVGQIEVTSPDVNAGYGNIMIIEYPFASMPTEFARDMGISNGQSLYLLYAHLQDAPGFEAGDNVVPYQPIGTIGNTGNSDGSHLHLEARIGAAGALGSGGPLCTNFCVFLDDTTPRYPLWKEQTAMDPEGIPWTNVTIPERWNNGWR